MVVGLSWDVFVQRNVQCISAFALNFWLTFWLSICTCTRLSLGSRLRDLLCCKDCDLTRLPLIERRVLMKSLVMIHDKRIRISEYVGAGATEGSDNALKVLLAHGSQKK
jgi:hypothetical protein